jgi:hypothetical protein
MSLKKKELQENQKVQQNFDWATLSNLNETAQVV